MRPDRFNRAGPFIVETVGDNPFLCGYKAWLPDHPESVFEFGNARELEEFFQGLCEAQTRSAKELTR